MGAPDEAREDLIRVETDIAQLREQERDLKDRIAHMTNLLQREGEDAHGFMYVTQEDLSTLSCYEVRLACRVCVVILCMMVYRLTVPPPFFPG